MFPFNQLQNNSHKGYENGERGNVGRQTQFFGTDACDESANISLFHQIEAAQQVPPFSSFRRYNELGFDVDSLPFQLVQDEHATLQNIHSKSFDLVGPKEERSNNTSSSSSLAILNKCVSKFRQSSFENVNAPSSNITCSKDVGLSINEIIRLAGGKFIKSSSIKVDNLPDLNRPFSTSIFSLSDEETRDVEIIHKLLSCAEKVEQKQFDCASKFLDKCEEYSSDRGSAVQRLVYYFSSALRERIDQEMGMNTFKMNKSSLDFEEAMRNPNPTALSLHQQIPFCQVMQFTGMQAIIENVAESKKIHIIDLAIGNGIQCSIFIQAFANRHVCPVEHLKITAVVTTSKTKIEETGKQLLNFANSMNLSFSFNVVMVDDMLELKESLFELDGDEVVAVYAPYILWTMIGQKDRLECLMNVIKTINPRVMVVTETEANHNSPIFTNRFIEALFFFGAYFDCLVDCMDPDDPNRFVTESIYFGEGIRNIVAAEGKERTHRQVKNNVWINFFSHFEMEQKELSMSSLYQASLVAQKFEYGSSCSLNLDAKSLIVGWKGTTVLSLSAWKFSR